MLAPTYMLVNAYMSIGVNDIFFVTSTHLTSASGQSTLTRLEVAKVLEALADPTRRAIFEAVRQKARAVNDIAGDFSVSRPAISQHLRVLEEARLLRSQRNGRQKFYSVDLYGLTLLRNYLDGCWEDVLGAFQAAAVRDTTRTRRRRR